MIMPKLEQPDSLQDTAMNILITFFATHCHRCSVEGSLDKLRQCIAIIKRDISPLIPSSLSAEFHGSSLCKFDTLRDPETRRARSHERAALELTMDNKISGLRCVTSMLFSLDLGDAHRIQGLTTLDLTHFCNPLLDGLKCFHLHDLTSFTFFDHCTDTELTVIGRNCRKLKYLDVQFSEDVTDVGLLALAPCSDLYFVCVSGCPVSLNGINDLLSVNKTIRTLSAWVEYWGPGFDCFSVSDSSVYPSIQSFRINLVEISNYHLQSVVQKFPNLTTLEIDGSLTGDLSIISSLSKLSKLDLKYCEMTGNNIEPLLRRIGAQIVEFMMLLSVQSDLNLIFEFCQNVKSLEFRYKAFSDQEMIIIPPFGKLENFSCNNYGKYVAGLELGQMLELRHFEANKFCMSTGNIESMILDHSKYPNLRSMAIDGLSHCDANRYRRIAKNKNLDLKFGEIARPIFQYYIPFNYL